MTILTIYLQPQIQSKDGTIVYHKNEVWIMNLDEMFPDDLFSGSPRKRYFDLFAIADQFVIENELLELFARLARLEQFVEAKGLDSELASFAADHAKAEKQIDNLIIESMAKIVSSHER